MRICGQQPRGNSDDRNGWQPIPPLCELFRKNPQILLIIEKVCGKLSQGDVAFFLRSSEALGGIVRRLGHFSEGSVLSAENTCRQCRTTQKQYDERRSQTCRVSFHASIAFVGNRPQACNLGRCITNIVVAVTIGHCAIENRTPESEIRAGGRSVKRPAKNRGARRAGA